MVTENVENLVLEELLAMRSDMARMGHKIDGMVQRIGSLETYVAQLHIDTAGVQLHLDRFAARMDRIASGSKWPPRRDELGES